VAGKISLVVKPKIKSFWLSKTLMDGGSNLNIMYYDTFKRIGLPETLVQPSKTTIHGIDPRRKAYSLGRVVLDVAFGSERNFRREKVCF
jgi:hypothetical protein